MSYNKSPVIDEIVITITDHCGGDKLAAEHFINTPQQALGGKTCNDLFRDRCYNEVLEFVRGLVKNG